MNKKLLSTLRLSHVHTSSRGREPRPGTDDAAVRPRGRSRARARASTHPPAGSGDREGAATARDACVTSPAPPRPSQSMTMGSWGSWAGRGVHPPGARRRGSGASSDGARASLFPTEEPNGGGGRADHPPPHHPPPPSGGDGGAGGTKTQFNSPLPLELDISSYWTAATGQGHGSPTGASPPPGRPIILGKSSASERIGLRVM